jgi:uncharacterized protein YndB with AHSA1/START domain
MTAQPAVLHELSITRLIDAPPQSVYRVWTERLGEWWAPRPYTTPVIELDLRPGGRCRTEMLAPDGTRMPHEGVFLEIVPNRKIVFTNAFTAGWMPQDPARDPCLPAFIITIVTFEPEGSGTRYTARVRHWDEEAVKRHEAIGFHAGWNIVAGQLADIAEAEAPALASA